MLTDIVCFSICATQTYSSSLLTLVIDESDLAGLVNWLLPAFTVSFFGLVNWLIAKGSFVSIC